MNVCASIAFNALKAYHYVLNVWNSLWSEYSYDPEYYLLNNDEWDHQAIVPENEICIEEWRHPQTGEKKCRVFYEHEEIPYLKYMNPFKSMHPVAKIPWVWVGDSANEIDLTRTLEKFIVVGNLIDKCLIAKFIQITDSTKIQYIDSTTYEMCDFPNEGIVIEEA
jgi:hypothetical protein